MREEPRHRLIGRMPLHPKQEIVWDVYFSGKYSKLCVVAGRRFGKSTVCRGIAAEEAVNFGKKVWWVGKTYKDAGSQWREMKRMLRGIYTSKSEQDHRLNFDYTLPDGTELHGEISFKSAETPDNLRGEGLDLLILDEAAFQSQEVWKVLRPSLVDREGKVIFISTPNGHNWFYTFFMRGQKENRRKYPSWWSRRFTSYDNPYLNPQELEDAKGDMLETEFRIEHMAEFIDDIGKVFTNVHLCATGVMNDYPKVPGNYSMGVDLARKHDATVISVVDVNTHTQVWGMRFVNEDWDLQKARIVAAIRAWNPNYIWMDATAVGEPVVYDIQKQVPEKTIVPFILTPSSKPPLIQQLAVKFQNKAITIIGDSDRFGRRQLVELQAYEIQISPNGLRFSYSAPRGEKDDTVIALALACQALTNAKSKMIVVENPFFKQAKAEEKIKSTIPMSEYRRKSHELKKALIEEARRQQRL